MDSSGTVSRAVVLERWRRIETPAMWFLLLNCLDMALTYIMLMYPRFAHETVAVEANQIARFFLDRWGLPGMFGFKLASALTVCGVAFVIALKKPDVARRTLMFGSLVLLVVVVYSTWLAHGFIYG